VVIFVNIDFREAASLGALLDSSYLAGVATLSGRMFLVVDIEKLLSAGELALLREAAGTVAPAS
jgi:purine-binding chemotaxis protein CheW